MRSEKVRDTGEEMRVQERKTEKRQRTGSSRKREVERKVRGEKETGKKEMKRGGQDDKK